MREPPVEFCPVPNEQQPLNEYEQLKESCCFRWVTLEQGQYWRKLSWLWLAGWLAISPIAAASFPLQRYPVRFGLSSTLGATLFLALVLLRLYLGWYYISDRLKSDKVFYEESGWYDGQIWQKPPSVLTRDRLIVSYQVLPILQRLQRTALILAAVVGSLSLLWLLP
jgi:hypothetical protein